MNTRTLYYVTQDPHGWGVECFTLGRTEPIEGTSRVRVLSFNGPAITLRASGTVTERGAKRIVSTRNRAQGLRFATDGTLLNP